MLQEYDTAAFARAKEFCYDTAMGIFVPSPQEKENMRLWCLGYYYHSLALGGNDLDGIDGRLVGVYKNTLEKRV